MRGLRRLAIMTRTGSSTRTNRRLLLFDRFKEDWSPTGQENDYGAIQEPQAHAAHMYGNVLVVGIYINGRKSKALFLYYDTKNHTLGFSPVELYLGP